MDDDTDFNPGTRKEQLIARAKNFAALLVFILSCMFGVIVLLAEKGYPIVGTYGVRLGILLVLTVLPCVIIARIVDNMTWRQYEGMVVACALASGASMGFWMAVELIVKST